MGCITSKNLLVTSFNKHHYDQYHDHRIQALNNIKNHDDENEDDKASENNELKCGRLLLLSSETENVAAAGWPSWLCEVAAEAVRGWLPLKSDSYEKFEKIGQGTYSSVFRARHAASGRMVALKKVRFDNLKPDSVKFMAREITILRSLDHPNIMKLEGIITSQVSCIIYLVFEYMEHDLAGLLSSPDIKFSHSQVLLHIKCYMRQLLNGIEHCHSRGVLHRDIKTANILVNNEGVLKIGDFGLAKIYGPTSKEPLTSHVVTLWYRPPELLLGCTKYGTAVDLWSVGCVFAELFLGRPILKGRTEVEQLHRIFKLCGTPPDDYWNKSKLPLATMFKPHHAYESTLHERCKDIPKTALNLIETLLSVDPCKRGTAGSALEFEYFNTKPYVCDPASLPKYTPIKQIQAKARDEGRRKKPGGVVGASRNPTRARKTCQEQTSFSKVVPTEVNAESHVPKGSRDPMSAFIQLTEISPSDGICALPTQTTASNGGFVWATRRRKHGGHLTQSSGSVTPRVLKTSASQRMPENIESTSRVCGGFRNPASFDISKVHNSQDLLNDDDESETFFDAHAE
ncbi:hypothetical protein CTI12_AA381350 [Artemisia annua]|uniref:Protein kinase domain-containing protein n=1 Tax=Artemisia annua TaxID=35608 RepID=A0A2U1MGV7_ARTAN|nr:hypothetical protein CTI12_AA381350 [Artemisia annua]